MIISVISQHVDSSQRNTSESNKAKKELGLRKLTIN